MYMYLCELGFLFSLTWLFWWMWEYARRRLHVFLYIYFFCQPFYTTAERERAGYYWWRTGCCCYQDSRVVHDTRMYVHVPPSCTFLHGKEEHTPYILPCTLYIPTTATTTQKWVHFIWRKVSGTWKESQWVSFSLHHDRLGFTSSSNRKRERKAAPLPLPQL